MSPLSSGLIFILIYNLLSSAKEVYVASLLQGIAPETLSFGCFVIVAVFFNFIQIINRRVHPRSSLKNLGDLLGLNITTVASWLSFFYSIKYLEPAVVSSITLSIGPVLTLCLAPIFRPSSKVSGSEVFAALGVFLGVFLLTLASIQGYSAVGARSTHDLTWGLLNCVIGGVSVVGNTFYSKRLSDSGWNATRIMAGRFYLLIVASLFVGWTPVSQETFLPSMILPFLAISFFGIIIPLYSLQLGIQRCEPMVVSLVLSVEPILSFLMQRLDHRLVLSLPSLGGIALICAFTLIGVLSRFKRSLA